MDLTDKQKAFCQEYIIDFNATQAAIRAGYSKNTARQIATTLLSKVYIQAEYNRLLDGRTERINISQDRVLYELAKIAFSDIGNYIDIDNANGVSIRDLQDIDTSVISETHETNTANGMNIKFKLCDKLKALELLSRHLGMLTDKTELTGKNGEAIENHIVVEFINDKDTISGKD